MAGKQSHVDCPVCSADIPLDTDARLGDYVYCSFCEIELKLLRDTRNPDPEAMRATEDLD